MGRAYSKMEESRSAFKMLTCEHIGKRHLVMTSSNEIVFNTMILTDFVQDRDCYQPLKMLYLTSGFYNSWD
jgi:hypothetical protein